MTSRMTEVSADELRRHVERLHGCRAEYRESVAIREEFQGQVAWEGRAHIFGVSGHPGVTKCYAWSAPIEGSENRRFYAVLHTDATPGTS